MRLGLLVCVLLCGKSMAELSQHCSDKLSLVSESWTFLMARLLERIENLALENPPALANPQHVRSQYTDVINRGYEELRKELSDACVHPEAQEALVQFSRLKSHGLDVVFKTILTSASKAQVEQLIRDIGHAVKRFTDPAESQRILERFEKVKDSAMSDPRVTPEHIAELKRRAGLTNPQQSDAERAKESLMYAMRHYLDESFARRIRRARSNEELDEIVTLFKSLILGANKAVALGNYLKSIKAGSAQSASSLVDRFMSQSIIPLIIARRVELANSL